MVEFDELVAAVFTPEDLADFARGMTEESIDKNIKRFLFKMKEHFPTDAIAAGLERAVDDLWREVEDQ